MNFKIADQDKEEVPFRLLSELANNPILPGSRGLEASGFFGTMHFLEVECPGFSVWHSNYNMELRTCLYCFMEEYMLELFFAMNNTLHFELDGLGEVILQPGQFNLIYAPYVKKVTWFQENEVYTNFGIHFTPDYLQQAAPHFPLLDSFLTKVRNGDAAMISKQHGQMTPEISGLVQKILHCHFSPEVRTMYLQSKVLELLLLSLDQLGNGHKSADISLRPYDIERIRAAHDYLLSNLDNPCTLIELSRKVGINDFKLKKGFKQVYGTTVYEFLLDVRIDKAKTLLLETEIPIIDIAFMTGYRTLPSFITAFKKKTGYSPGSFKKIQKGKA